MFNKKTSRIFPFTHIFPRCTLYFLFFTISFFSFHFMPDFSLNTSQIPPLAFAQNQENQNNHSPQATQNTQVPSIQEQTQNRTQGEAQQRAASHLQTHQPSLAPLTVQIKQDITFLAPYMTYAHNLQVHSPQDVYNMRSSFAPYNPLHLLENIGSYWFFMHFDRAQDQNIAAAYLDLGNFLPKNALILILPKNATQWQILEDVYTREKRGIAETQTTPKKDETNPLNAFASDFEERADISIFSSGLYDLTSLRNGGELLIYSPGMPSLWFSPSLVLPAKAALSIDRRIAPFVLISLTLLMLFSLWRGLREEGDARLWASLLTFFAIIQYIWGVPESTHSPLGIWNMIGLISASCAIFLLPHIGRHFMITEKNAPSLDAFLQFLALPAVFPIAIVFMPLTEYLPIIRFVPLWGMYAFLPLIVCLPAFFKNKKGAKLYVFFCLCIGLSSALAFYFRYNPPWHIAPQVGLFLAISAMFLAPRQTEKNVFEKEHIATSDIIDNLVENSIPLREAFFRVEAKLREPFDKIIRETCFLDFDTKSEDFTYSLDLLAEKEFADKYTKNDLNAIDDLVRRATRLQNHTSSLVNACRDMSSMMGIMPQLAKKIPSFQTVHELFNIKTLVLQAFDLIREEAQDKQVGLGWYIAPQMGLFYRGDKNTLFDVIELLLKDSVRATEKGMISLRVRRANSPNPGHIVFTISDSGKGRPPIERSPLTLIKAWELATNYNGEVALNSSPTGLSFSFSMECIAMDAEGLKALSFASLDDIVLLNRNVDKARVTALSSGESGGNIVFSKETQQRLSSEQSLLEKKRHDNIQNKGAIDTANNEFSSDTHHSLKTSITTSAKASATTFTETSTEASAEAFAETPKERLQQPHKSPVVENTLHANAESLTHHPHDLTKNFSQEKAHNPLLSTSSLSLNDFEVFANNTQNAEFANISSQQYTDDRISILLISPLAIQRQNLAWYLNRYELWEALDVDSALAFYEKKPAMLVIVHSALSANGCNEVLAGIRLLEDSLGISPAPFLGLYQSAKDMEFLKLAGCKHLLPANIGREDLCIAVAEIMHDPLSPPISDIHAPHLVLHQDHLKLQEDVKESKIAAKLAVEKRLNMKREHAGQVIDGDLAHDIYDATTNNNAGLLDLASQENISNIPTTSKNMHDQTSNVLRDHLSHHDTDNAQKIPLDNNVNPLNLHTEVTKANPRQVIHTEDSNIIPNNQNTIEEQTGVFSKFLNIIRPKPNKSIQTEMDIIDDFVGTPTPIIKNSAQSLNRDILENITPTGTESVESMEAMGAMDAMPTLDIPISASHDIHLAQEQVKKEDEQSVEIQENINTDNIDTDKTEEREKIEAQEITEIIELTERVDVRDKREEREQTEEVEKEQSNTIEAKEKREQEKKEEQEEKIENADRLTLTFFPTKEQSFQGIDEDVPTLGSLSSALHIDSIPTELEKYHDLETQNTFVHSGLLTRHQEYKEEFNQKELARKNFNKKNFNGDKVNGEEANPDKQERTFAKHEQLETQELLSAQEELIEQEELVAQDELDTQNVLESEEIIHPEKLIEEDDGEEDDEDILDLTDSMLIPNSPVDPDKISLERRTQNANNALLNLDLEMPLDPKEKKKNKKISQRIHNKNGSDKKKLEVILQEETVAILQTEENIQQDDATLAQKKDSKPKIEQLSFFPVTQRNKK